MYLSELRKKEVVSSDDYGLGTVQSVFITFFFSSIKSSSFIVNVFSKLLLW